MSHKDTKEMENCPVTPSCLGDFVVIAGAKSSDRMGRVFDGWRESPERRFDGSASLEVKGSSRQPKGNKSDKTIGNQRRFSGFNKPRSTISRIQKDKLFPLFSADAKAKKKQSKMRRIAKRVWFIVVVDHR
jgi:hypothetical protein